MIVPDTRSSASITATLFDYVVNRIGGCGGGLSTQENAASSREIGANGTISSGTDTAKLQITGTGVWGGDLTWYLCGPNVSGCDNTGYVVTTKTVASTNSQCGGDPNGVCTYTSDTATLTSALGNGEYCWHAHFAPNPDSLAAGVDPQDDNGDNECFFVTPKTPTLTTAAVEPVGLLSPTMCGGLADLNGDCGATTPNVDPTPDNASVFYGSTDIIGGKLDCNAWGSTVNAGTAGNGSAGTGDTCDLLAWNGTSNVTIHVVDGVFQVADGTALRAIFPNPSTPSDHTIAGASFAWSTDDGRVDANGDGSIDPSTTSSQDCSINVVNSYDVLGSACQGYAIPQGNGLVDLNDDGKITPADSCTSGCFLGHNVSSGFVVAGPVPIGGTIEDVATLSGTANNPDPLNTGTNTAFPTINGGTKPADSQISWLLYPPGTGGAADCTTTPVTPTGSPITVSGDGTYGPVTYTTNHAGDKVGKYEFAATYPGEGPNTNAPSSQVACDPTGANGEQVTITGSATSSSAQRWLPNDRVVLNSTPGTTLHGTLTVTLYKGAFSGMAGNCTAGSGTAVTDRFGASIAYTFNPNGAASGTAFNTTNTTFFVGTDSDGTADGADASYFWLIHYHDNTLTSPNDRCETSTISHNDG